jgi:hypothetical protein
VRQAQLEQNLAPDTFDPCANSEYPGLAASKFQNYLGVARQINSGTQDAKKCILKKRKKKIQ